MKWMLITHTILFLHRCNPKMSLRHEVKKKEADKPQFVSVFAIVPVVLNRTLVALRQYDQRALTPSLSAVPIPLEGLILTDSCAEGGPCSELS